MAKTYTQLTQEIETLKAKAEAVRQREKAGVAARIRDAIAVYGLTAEELGFGRSGGAPKARSANAASAPSPVTPATLSGIKYRDDAGHAWSGRGPKPGWLKAGLAAGRSLESFRADGGGEGRNGAAPVGRVAATEAAAGSRRKAAGKKSKTVVKYRDDAGHEWSGRGPKPGWFKAALESGKTLAELGG